MWRGRRNPVVLGNNTSDAKPIGENANDTAIGRRITKPAPGDVTTPELARELLAPLLENPPA